MSRPKASTPLARALYERRVYAREQSPGEAAVEVGCSRQTWYKWERGTRPADLWLSAVAKYLDVSPAEADALRRES